MKNTCETITLPDMSLTLVDANGEQSIKLPQYISDTGLGLVLYFYPKDNTQGCSVQAIDFSALISDFADLGYTIIGVSRDEVRSHINFIDKKELAIALISDSDEILCQHFGVIQEKMMYGKTHLGVVRSTFVFNKDGKMTHSYRNVKAKEHAQSLLNILAQ